MLFQLRQNLLVAHIVDEDAHGIVAGGEKRGVDVELDVEVLKLDPVGFGIDAVEAVAVVLYVCRLSVCFDVDWMHR